LAAVAPSVPDQAVAFERAYARLRGIAANLLARERPDHTLQPTALVHEAWLRLGAYREREALGPGELELLASQVMRRVLTDHARARGRHKRDAGRRDQSRAVESIPDEAAMLVVEVDRALTDLLAFDPQSAQIVELRFFGGHTLEEIAALTHHSLRTVNRRWRLARAWLQAEISGVIDPDDAGSPPRTPTTRSGS